MYNEISSAIASAKVALDIAKAAHGLSNYNELVAAVSEVNAKLVDATVVTLASRVGDLEKELVQIKNWKTEADNYEILEVARGVFAHVIKGNVQPLHSAHKLCSNCFNKYEKSLLQESRDTAAPRHYKLSCQSCGSKMPFHNYTDNS